MKKQFLFLAFFTVVFFFAGITNIFAQLLQRTTPAAITPLSCGTNANFLHPIAGTPYVYQMDGSTGAETVSSWTWFATKNPAFVTGRALASDSLKEAAGQILQAGANYAVLNSASNSVTITWTPELLANTQYQGTPSTTAFPSPTFVVGYGKGAAGCADNIKVYEINPILTFTVDIANIDPVTKTTLAWDTKAEQCVDVVQSATYTTGTYDLLMDYGKDTIYYEVTAANFNTNFRPYFRLVSGLQGVQTAVVTLYNTLADAQAGTNVRATQNWAAGDIGQPAADWDSNTLFTAANSNEVANGVSLFVRVIITNTTYESLTLNPFTLAVDARDFNNTGIWDMEDADCSGTPTDAADQVDTATHDVKPRPTITGVSDSNPAAPNNIVPKNP